jgi:hypothetical protein
MAKSKRKAAAKRGTKKRATKAKSKAKARKVSKPKAKRRVSKPKKKSPLANAVSAVVGTVEDTTALHARMAGKNTFED